MKSRTKPALRVLPPAEVQISLPVQGVLRDVQHAFLGLCIDAGQKVLAALMEADRVALCGAKGVPDAARQATRGGAARAARSCWVASASRCADRGRDRWTKASCRASAVTTGFTKPALQAWGGCPKA